MYWYLWETSDLMTVRLLLPCLPLVKEYLQNRYGTTFALNRKDLEHKLIAKSLNGKRRNRYNWHATDYTESVVIEMDNDLRKRVGLELTPSEVFELNQLMKKMIYSSLFDYLDISLSLDEDFPISEGILAWCRAKGLSDDVAPLDTMKKAYYRHRLQCGEMVKQSWSRRKKAAIQSSNQKAA